MKKVIFVIDTLETGGAETSLVEIARRFKKFTPVFIHVYKGDALKQRLVDEGIRVYSLNIESKYGFDLAVKKIVPIISEVAPDIVHSTLSRSDIIGRKLKNRVNLPLVNSLVSNSYHPSRYSRFSLVRKFKHRLVQFLDRYTASKVDLFISNSLVIKKDNMKALNLDEKKIKVIPRGRESKNFSFSQEEVEELKRKLGFEGKKIILNVGRLIETKGQLDLIKAFPKITYKHPKAILLIAGEGPFREKLEKEVVDKQLKNKVFLLGSRSDIPRLLAIADVFVFTSYLEGLPGSLIEAMMSKTLIICSDIPENKECVPENAGIFYRTGDINQLSLTISENLEEENSTQDFVDNALRHALEHYELENIAALYEETYLQFLKS